MDRLIKYRVEHLEEVNRRSTYKQIKITEKQRHLIYGEEKNSAGIVGKIEWMETDLDELMYNRMQEV